MARRVPKHLWERRLRQRLALKGWRLQRASSPVQAFINGAWHVRLPTGATLPHVDPVVLARLVGALSPEEVAEE